MIYDTLENASVYPFGPAFEKAVRFVRELDPAIALGRYELDGDKMYVSVMESETQEGLPTKYEVHRKYADLQAVISGSETIFVRQAANLPVVTPYKPDCEFLASDGKAADVNVQLFPGYFTLLFPQDAHMGRGISCLGKSKVKKLVVKIALELLRS